MSTFKCDECNGVFDEEPGDPEAAVAEAAENFPDLDVKDMARVCDDCFHKLMGEQGHIGYAGSKE
jgi:rubredoxin